MLVSVIVPVYNVEKYLEECLDSLLAQTYPDLEVIMVDDGSTDDSGKICDRYAGAHKNFYVYHKNNAGLGMARNTGLEHIRGEYVTFVDSDDYLDPEYISVLLYKLIDAHVDVCKSGFRRVLDNKEEVYITEYTSEVYVGDLARSTFLSRLIGSSPSKRDSVEMCVCGALYNANIIKKCYIRFPSEREYISEDMVFNIDYMQHASGACLIDDVMYNYRVTDCSLTRRYREDRFEKCKFFYQEISNKLQKLGYSEDTIYRLDRMFFVYIRGCIRQERHNTMGSRKALENIKIICSDEVVQGVIGRYPVRQLQIKPRVFLFLVRHKMARILYWAA